jgi:hypothetical protein
VPGDDVAVEQADQRLAVVGQEPDQPHRRASCPAAPL